jgi:hypothetical protein
MIDGMARGAAVRDHAGDADVAGQLASERATHCR